MATNYKAMFTFFDRNKNFRRNHSGTYLKENNIKVDVDVLIFRNPFERFASFYADKITNGNYRGLYGPFVSQLGDIFGTDMMGTHLEEVRKKVTIDALALFLPDLAFSEPHLFPQKYCMNWIRPKRIIRMESDLNVLSEMFVDTDFSKKKNETGPKERIGEKAKKVIRKVYEVDFDFMYPEFL